MMTVSLVNKPALPWANHQSFPFVLPGVVLVTVVVRYVSRVRVLLGHCQSYILTSIENHSFSSGDACRFLPSYVLVRLIYKLPVTRKLLPKKKRFGITVSVSTCPARETQNGRRVGWEEQSRLTRWFLCLRKFYSVGRFFL